MLEQLKKYPFLAPLLGLLLAYFSLRLSFFSGVVQREWSLSLLMLPLVFLGYWVGFRRFHGVWRLLAVCLFHWVFGVLWFGDTYSNSIAQRWPWQQDAGQVRASVLVEVRDSWLAGPSGIKGSVYCYGWRDVQQKLHPLDLCFRVSLRDSTTRVPAIGKYWVPAAVVKFYGGAEIPGDPNWRNIMQALGIAGYVRYGDFWRSAIGGDIDNGVAIQYRIRSRLLVWLHKEFYERMNAQHAGLVYAMLLGDKSGLDPQLEAQFGSAGLLHVLAVSGMHVALIMGALFWLFSGFGARGNPGLFLLGVLIAAGWGYTFLTGSGASVVRAMISATWMWLGKFTMKRKQSLIHVLMGSAYLQWLFDPACVAQMGFQLSYLAVLGIALFQPVVADRFADRPSWLRWLIENMALTLSATLFTLPLLLWQFHQFPTWFLLGNLLLLPLFSICVYFALVCLLMGWIPLLGDGLYTMFDACLNGLLALLGFGDRLPMSQLQALPMDGWDLCLLSLLLACLSLWLVRTLEIPVAPVKVISKGFMGIAGVKLRLMWLMGAMFLSLWGHLEWQRTQRIKRSESFGFAVGKEVVLVRKKASHLQVAAHWRNRQMKNRAWRKLQMYAARNGVAHVEWINRLPLYYD